MNERIRELALEARLGPALLLHHWGKVDALTDSEQEALEQIEKFAELIVRECAKLNKKQSYELSGVIADTEKFGGFDLVCLDTVKRVEQYLASDTLINHFNKKDDIL